MKRYLRRKSITEKGITLVALVVTIIILLILAGVTLNLVLSNNGLIGRAKKGATVYQNASLNEQIELDRKTEMIDDLVDEIEKVLKIKDKNGNKISIDQIANHYGDNVIYNTKEYQLFYVDIEGKYGDVGRIYLKSTDLVSEIKLSDHRETTGVKNTTSLIYKLNPDWAKVTGESLTTVDDSALNDNIKSVAYLCNTANWNTTYVPEEDQVKGVWAIGTVPVEMFCASYNEKMQPDVEFSAKAFEDRGTIGYRYKPVSGEGYGYETSWSYHFSGMYYPGYNKSLWLASPAGYNSGTVCDVYGYSNILSWASDINELSIWPMVSLPAGYEIQLQ